MISEPPSDVPPAPRIGRWDRLHPLTPYLRSWAVLVALTVAAVSNWASILAALRAGVGGDDASPVVVLAGASGVAVAVLALFTAWALLSWRMTRYRIDDDALEYESGVVFRRHRQARLDRLQAVDVVRPLIARLAGLSELRLEVAGGAGSDVRLQYLRADDAHRLRDTLLARADPTPPTHGASDAAPSGDQTEQPGDRAQPAGGPAQRLLVAVPVGRLVGSWLLGSVSVVSVLALLVIAPLGLLAPGVIFAAVPAAIGLLIGGLKQVASSYGFTATSGSDGLRLRYGLFETRTQTVPVDRVQAVRLRQPLLWRLCDWWAVEVNIAGYGSAGSGGQASSGQTMLPVGTRAEAVLMMAQVLPDPGVADPMPLIDDGLTGRSSDVAGAANTYVCAPRRSRWLDPIAWRRNGFAATATALFLRSGVIGRRLTVVPHARTQSIAVTAGPIQGTLGLASVQLHSTPGPVHPKVRHLDSSVAARLVDEQAGRARLARGLASADRRGATFDR